MLDGNGLTVWNDALAELKLYFETTEKRFLGVCMYMGWLKVMPTEVHHHFLSRASKVRPAFL